jgi:HK97 family phage major capsid protein
MIVEFIKPHLSHPTGERVDLSEADANDLAARGIAKKIDDDPLAEVVAKTINLQIERALKDFASKLTLSKKNALPAIFGHGAGDPEDTFGSFLLAVRTRDHKRLEGMGSSYADWHGRTGRKVALNEQSGPQGGFTVPSQFIPNLLSVAAESSVVPPRATRIPMTTNTTEVPALNITTAPTAGETSFFGGLQANWEEEAATLDEEEPTFKQIRLTAHQLSGYTLASNELIADNAIGLEAVLTSLFGGALGWFVDRACLRGTGAGQPMGILNAPALISVTRSAASAFSLADAAGMLARMLPGWQPSSTVWAMHPTVLVKLWQMSSAAGNVVYIDNARERTPMSLFGIPVQVTEKLPALNTLGDVMLLDCKHYLFGDRQMVEIAFSEHFRFTNNQGAWRFVSRVDGQPWLNSTVTLSDASSTLSPFVALAAG